MVIQPRKPSLSRFLSTIAPGLFRSNDNWLIQYHCPKCHWESLARKDGKTFEMIKDEKGTEIQAGTILKSCPKCSSSLERKKVPIRH